MPELSSIKLIPVGQGSQSRIAQACDRCRSKKIKCDGLRPSCSQCAAVDFECKTSDKLSRRAFPRGYTENLEVRVRDLEKANRELKFELESQEEKIAFLSKGPQQSAEASQSVRGASTERCASIGPLASRDAIGVVKDGSPGMSPGVVNLHSASISKPSALKCFKTQPPTLHLDVESSDSFFMGASSGRPSIETFRRQLQERAKSCPSFNADAFLHILGCPPLVSGSSPPAGSFTPSPFPGRDAEINAGHPPRIFTDQCVSVFFTEWAPFFPVLRRTDFLTAYALFTKDPERVKDTVKLCQIHLVFCIAGLSSDQPEIEIIAGCEEKWKTLLNTLLCSQTVDILQCLVLAMIYCMLRGTHRQVQHYRSIAVGIAQRLGLHHQQRNFSFGVLTLETRKKVFWTLYTVDCFAAASMGLPRLINDHWVQTEYPIDADDHNISENGIQPGLPNARTTMSNALALFQAMRCMAKVLDYAYSSCAVNISIPKLQELDSEIIAWEQSLPSHQRLVFVGDSAELVHSDNALNASILAITYYYIRILITRLIIDNKTPQCLHTAIISVSRFSRRIIKISQCLEERRQAFAICLNKADLLALAGFSVLFEGVTINQASSVKLSPITANATLQNAVPFIDYVVKTLFRLKAPGCQDFKQAAAAFVRLEGGQCQEGPEERDLSLHRPRSETGTMTTTGTKGTKGSLFRGSPLHQNSTSSVALHHKLKLASARNSISGPVLPSMLYEGAKSDFDMPSASSQSSLFIPPAPLAAAGRSRRMTLAGPMHRPVLGHAAINLHQSGIMPSAPGDIGYELYSRPMEEDTPASLKPTAFSDFPGTAGAFFLDDTFSDSPLQTEDWFDAIYGNLHPKAAPLMWVNHDDVPSTEGPPSLAGVSVQSHITEELPQRPATVTLGAQGNNGKDGIPGLSGDILEGLVGFT